MSCRRRAVQIPWRAGSLRSRGLCCALLSINGRPPPLVPRRSSLEPSSIVQTPVCSIHTLSSLLFPFFLFSIVSPISSDLLAPVVAQNGPASRLLARSAAASTFGTTPATSQIRRKHLPPLPSQTRRPETESQKQKAIAQSRRAPRIAIVGSCGRILLISARRACPRASHHPPRHPPHARRHLHCRTPGRPVL